MSLYYDAVSVLTEPATGGSFKSRIYSARNLRAAPAQVYALIIEASKWDRVLADVIEHADLLSLERKLTPLLALLLVHDHLLKKNGIAAPAAHPLRQAVERHKVRLKAEFSKARVRRGCASVEQFKAAILREKREAGGTDQFVYPRWVRINNICTTLEDQMRTTFSDYRKVETIAELAPCSDDRKAQRLLYLDPNIPDLIAVPYGADFTSSPAYKNGEIILQDKASCFPAYLLLGDRGPSDAWEGDLVDGCAAPGNKTTHMASLLAKQGHQQKKRKARNQIFSMDASAMRSKTLQKMVSQAGTDSVVTVLPGQDFLALDHTDPRFENVSGLLLDPSCSGSGIIGRDDVPQLILPQPAASKNAKPQGKKRKRRDDDHPETRQQPSPSTASTTNTSPSDENDIPVGAIDHERLIKLSSIQARIVEHALGFPKATHVTYSTCSIHLIENEAVVARILHSEIAQQRGWRLLRRDEQPAGLRKWNHRGVRQDRGVETDVKAADAPSVDLSDEALDACVRCWSGDAEGLGGFFVAGFVRDPQSASATSLVGDSKTEREEQVDEEDEWAGFSD
ncbi:hypothetical protein N7492_002213 [Penicillium capsulatum]|uniref:SAM-dependent MTase RsmB/NOP-type domain-containing protein n=1 Tax=Penicillium capsulatum TaxID=69766 RepID=A0A9W9LUX1_9EURO|nr:hypothetical protein N7492_002213 [Penicillium capsulatum]KAJ6123180.1 hypothetical protein N7512_005645 [Penicillium capsulatum]